jgi:hypothetical protein
MKKQYFSSGELFFKEESEVAMKCAGMLGRPVNRKIRQHVQRTNVNRVQIINFGDKNNTPPPKLPQVILGWNIDFAFITNF